MLEAKNLKTAYEKISEGILTRSPPPSTSCLAGSGRRCSRFNLHRHSKNPGPEGPALVCPWKAALPDPALHNILMECWSNGILEKRTANTDLLQL